MFGLVRKNGDAIEKMMNRIIRLEKASIVCIALESIRL